MVARRVALKRKTWCLWQLFFFLFCWTLVHPLSVSAQEVKVFVSSKAGDRLSSKGPLHFHQAGPNEKTSFQINPSVTYQTMAGFGASFLEAGMVCLNSLAPSDQEAVLQALFDPVKGAGFSAMKTVIAGTDFMSAGPWYSYDDTSGDVEMKHFSIQRDLGPNGLVTYIKRARKYGTFALQAPMDYPPDWMLFDVVKNQDVNPKYFPALALYYLKYLQEYEKNGIFIDYLSLFNEPGIYTKIPFDKIRDLLKNYVGPLLEKSGSQTKIMLSEAGDRSDACRNYPTLLDDPDARKYVAAMPYHAYRPQEIEKERMEALHKRYPDLPLWMTEICHSYYASTPYSIPIPQLSFEDGDYWGNQIFDELEMHASAWVYWNMILDEKGGPWLVSPVHGNPENNTQHAVVIVDRTNRKATLTGLYYYLAHFSKFVRPGAQRIEASGDHRGVRCMAFGAPQGEYIIQLLNSYSLPADVTLRIDGKTVAVNLPPISISTLIGKP
jgi:glucosylceramidase